MFPFIPRRNAVKIILTTVAAAAMPSAIAALPEDGWTRSYNPRSGELYIAYRGPDGIPHEYVEWGVEPKHAELIMERAEADIRKRIPLGAAAYELNQERFPS